MTIWIKFSQKEQIQIMRNVRFKLAGPTSIQRTIFHTKVLLRINKQTFIWQIEISAKKKKHKSKRPSRRRTANKFFEPANLNWAKPGCMQLSLSGMHAYRLPSQKIPGTGIAGFPNCCPESWPRTRPYRPMLYHADVSFEYRDLSPTHLWMVRQLQRHPLGRLDWGRGSPRTVSRRASSNFISCSNLISSKGNWRLQNYKCDFFLKFFYSQFTLYSQFL